MRRKLSFLLLVTSTAVLVVATAAAAVQPIVSPKADPYYRFGGLKGTKGFGQVKPREIAPEARASLKAGLKVGCPPVFWDGAVRQLLRSEPEVLD